METLFLIWRHGNGQTCIRAILNFMSGEVYQDFLQADNKRSWLQYHLELPESYFWNTYLEDPDRYITEKDNEYIIDKELEKADKFYIK